MSEILHLYPILYGYRLIGLVFRVFAGRPGFSPRSCHIKVLKLVLIPPYCNVQPCVCKKNKYNKKIKFYFVY